MEEEIPKNIVKDIFDAWAIQGLNEEFAAGNATCREFLREYLPFPKDKFKYLELGCSNGWATRFVSELQSEFCEKAIGVDVSPRMIWKASHYFSNSPNIEFQCSDLLTYKPNNFQFDIVFSFACLYYIVPMESMKHKIREWIKPGGIFAAGVDLIEENRHTHHWPNMLNVDMDIRSKDGWKKLFEESFGLKNVKEIVLQYPIREEGEHGTLFLYGTVDE